MLSLQDTTVLPVEWSKALDNLRNKADAMPEEELKEIFKREWGVGIEDVNGGNVVGFNRRVEEGGLGEGADRDHWLLDYCSIPDSHVLKMSTSGSPVTVGDIKSIRPQAFASASIGQVHLATLKDDSHLILKVQYPDILTSITNDIANLQGLIRYMNVVPKGVFLDSIIEQGVREVEGECDYEREQRGMARYRSLLEGGERPALRATLVGEGVLAGLNAHHPPNPPFFPLHSADPELKALGFQIPKVVPGLTTKRILVTEYAYGVTIDKCEGMSQEVRDNIGRGVLRLTLLELFVWR